MPSDREVLAAINAAFGDVPKPDHFTNYTHCEECAEHDETLRTHDRDTPLVSHVDNPGWDPLCFTSPHGKAYYMPALAKFALDPPVPNTAGMATSCFFICTPMERGMSSFSIATRSNAAP
jgi:hypothetical protein